MIDWQVKQTICGLAELEGHTQAGVTHLLSIIDPAEPEPEGFLWSPPKHRLTLRFHDIILPVPTQTLPTRADVTALLEFGRTLPDGDPAHLLVHCHMGVSRSTAAMAAIMLQARPDADEDAVLARIEAIRPQAWPNSLLIRFADDALGREGRLVAATGRLYRRQLTVNPRFADPLRVGGRVAEVEMAEAAGR